MADDVVIRLNRPQERDILLGFIASMGFNPRDAVTWDALQMMAMTAWRGDHLIGAIPLEPRPFQIRPGLVVPIVHETVVAVEPAERSGGIGSRMQDAIVCVLPTGAPLASVFREEPDSPAYRWYAKNGFAPAMRVDSWFLEAVAVEHRAIEVHDPARTAPDWAEMAELWKRCLGSCHGGFVDRLARPLDWWLGVHPYRTRYVFRVVCSRDHGQLVGYALVGMGRMHSETVRLDVLEAVASSPVALKGLLCDVLVLAAEHGCRPVRWPIACDDPSTAVARELRFEPRWSFDMLVRPLQPGIERELNATPAQQWRYAGIDYI